MFYLMIYQTTVTRQDPFHDKHEMKNIASRGTGMGEENAIFFLQIPNDNNNYF